MIEIKTIIYKLIHDNRLKYFYTSNYLPSYINILTQAIETLGIFDNLMQEMYNQTYEANNYKNKLLNEDNLYLAGGWSGHCIFIGIEKQIDGEFKSLSRMQVKVANFKVILLKINVVE